ncbi:uncharacterized protein MYCFIDRAFT_180058 [Pseudocercospora fijiensis CIRAD86]|uniref:Uncharacterized protein n=1 Tax=Pseudocercospora fijiensis (strain CIRAD86) TaxID=383855 RepID=M3AI69_PSEFD|nr:uncharacterized protein MYCFIDRAFT_180058 [Pseudocercospora fijiensis CIRAD86]EME77182.1 hypothetical protein MYCFIDRAFT_180058 [Pseudocercospora fijiensis CIRAD86]
MIWKLTSTASFTVERLCSTFHDFPSDLDRLKARLNVGMRRTSCKAFEMSNVARARSQNYGHDYDWECRSAMLGCLRIPRPERRTLGTYEPFPSIMAIPIIAIPIIALWPFPHSHHGHPHRAWPLLCSSRGTNQPSWILATQGVLNGVDCAMDDLCIAQARRPGYLDRCCDLPFFGAAFLPWYRAGIGKGANCSQVPSQHTPTAVDSGSFGYDHDTTAATADRKRPIGNSNQKTTESSSERDSNAEGRSAI